MKKMEQNNNNLSDISDPNYDPSKDPEVQPDTIIEGLVEWKNNLPCNIKRYIMIIGMLILIFLVVFLGYARGALDVCNALDGRLEVNLLHIECHPRQYSPTTDASDSYSTAVGDLE